MRLFVVYAIFASVLNRSVGLSEVPDRNVRRESQERSNQTVDSVRLYIFPQNQHRCRCQGKSFDLRLLLKPTPPCCDQDSLHPCLLYTSPSPRDRTRSRMPSSA